jgi:EAL domain-containing protein (putative c-di-GMP-specific phosphodiesterase class I)
MARQFIHQIRALGCSIALDDFGTGMSSLGYLRDLGVDTVKIDGSFIADIEQNPLNQTIVKAIVEIARQLDIRTVAEYAVNAAVIERLRTIGVCAVQGEAVGRPMPLEAFSTRPFPTARPSGPERRRPGAAPLDQRTRIRWCRAPRAWCG